MRLRLWLLWLTAFSALFLIAPLASQAMDAYDCPSQATNDNAAKPVLAYDTATVLTANKSWCPVINPCSLLAICAESLAAESTGIGPSNIRWVDERAAMNDAARAYEDAATGARSGVETQSRQVPVIEGPGGNPVKFDGLDGTELIDRKTAVTTFPKSQEQALRQSLALKQNGLTARWEVPTQAEATRASRMFQRLGINNITVIVVPR